MSDPYLITLGQAAKQAKVAKSTITRAIEKGELSFKEKTESGSYRIDPAEVDRWQSNRPKQPLPESDVGRSETLAATVETAVKTAVLEKEVEHLKEMVELQKQRAETAERRASAVEVERDAWRDQAKTALALTGPAAPSRRGLFGWFGRKTPAAT